MSPPASTKPLVSGCSTLDHAAGGPRGRAAGRGRRIVPTSGISASTSDVAQAGRRRSSVPSSGSAGLGFVELPARRTRRGSAAPDGISRLRLRHPTRRRRRWESRSWAGLPSRARPRAMRYRGPLPWIQGISGDAALTRHDPSGSSGVNRTRRAVELGRCALTMYGRSTRGPVKLHPLAANLSVRCDD